MDEKNHQMAHRRMVAIWGILRNRGRNNNSPPTGFINGLCAHLDAVLNAVIVNQLQNAIPLFGHAFSRSLGRRQRKGLQLTPRVLRNVKSVVAGSIMICRVPPLSNGDRVKILRTIKKLVADRHINVSNPKQDYRPWLSLVHKQTPRLMEAEREGFETGVSELLKALGSSHTAFFHQRRDSIPAPYSINATLRPVETVHGRRWMFVDVI